MMWRRVLTQLRRARRDDEGAALVEFGLLLPTLLLFFAVAVEGSRLFWSYQSTIAGVRDAARFVGRSAPSNICDTGGNLNSYNAVVLNIVRDTSSGASVFPGSIEVTEAASTLTCVAGPYRLDETPIATVTATLQIAYPFSGVFGFFGVTLDPVTTSVTDRTRVFGA